MTSHKIRRRWKKDNLEQWHNHLGGDKRQFNSMVLTFFAGASGIIMENLTDRFYREVMVPKAQQNFDVL